MTASTDTLTLRQGDTPMPQAISATLRSAAPAAAHRSGRRAAAAGAALALALACLSPTAALADEQRRPSAPQATERLPLDDLRGRDAACRGDADADAEAYTRTELFFGLSRPGGVVTEDDFKTFVDLRVTPRFPDGLTVIAGNGQFRAASGATIVEGAKLLVLLYPRRDRDAGRKIEHIRDDYKRQFQQESVLRADEPSCVSF